MGYRNFITSILEQTSQIARANFGRVSATTKPEDNNQTLTQTDLDIGNYLVEAIRGQFPNHSIIDEELGVIANEPTYTWVIDPIDGTSNFANGIPTYGIMVGLLRDERPLVGGIALPQFSEIYYAEKGQGAFCNDQIIHVTSEPRLLSCLVAYGIDGHRENPQITHQECQLLADIILNSRNLRSSNSIYDSALVAKGSYGAEINRTSRIWDNVARQILIEEAGGVYTEFHGRPIDYSRPLTKTRENYEYCAAAPVLHRQLQRIIHSGDQRIET